MKIVVLGGGESGFGAAYLASNRPEFLKKLTLSSKSIRKESDYLRRSNLLLNLPMPKLSQSPEATEKPRRRR